MNLSEPPKPRLQVLKDKRILLISPQPWSHLPISKHHYAEELARDNTVYFLEPPGTTGIPQLESQQHPKLTRLRIITWRPFVPKVLRFHAYPIYCAAIASVARWLTRHLGQPDIVWCFDFNVFPDLRAFGAPLKIFHPVDPLTSRQQVDIAESADLVISVSERILSNFSQQRTRSHTLLVNHGLSGPFSELALSPTLSRRSGPIRCGSFGNLDRSIINVDLLALIAQAHPDVVFHFWGPCKDNGPFYARLACLPNVVIHGAVEKAELARESAEMDLFVLAYMDHPTESDRSNAHKLLEYMSTGRPIVSTRMDCYADDEDLVRMSQLPNDADFPDLFRSTVDAIESLNSESLVSKRKAFSRQFSYSANVAKIDATLAQILVKGQSG
jgi:glycosyltransferase involved in cell wall biosynthesis